MNCRSYCRRQDADNPTRTCRQFLYMNSLCSKQQEFNVQIRTLTSSYYKMVLICCSFCYKKRTCDNSHVHLALALSTAVCCGWGDTARGTAYCPCTLPFFLNAKSGAFSAISPREAHSMNYEARAYRYISDHSVSLFGISPLKYIYKLYTEMSVLSLLNSSLQDRILIYLYKISQFTVLVI